MEEQASERTNERINERTNANMHEWKNTGIDVSVFCCVLAVHIGLWDVMLFGCVFYRL